ncbi:ATP-binding protein [Phytohabitans rumicis]|uniref:HTH luxR-type domain-containing protein n=2 Tax=Phytohabitans rumicis TaxID=1076125 RepID=A0A6V8LE62_9ACTN|nr:AAA family ATPase [Phytohabitans rumicis]GFJ95513.1 hypothetical protein Prum_091550 [Phytohabitans rumicis]
MFGRRDEISRIEAALAEQAGNGFLVITIDGEPGVGKTRLLTELLERARRHGLTVLSGRATEFERVVPFGTYVDALAPLTAGFTSAALRTLLTAATGRVPADDRLDRYHTYRGIQQMLGRLATERAAVLALDDLHWSDEPSLELTEYLLRRPPPGRLVLALTSRTGLTPPPIAEAVASLDPPAIRLNLRPLDEAAYAAMLPHVDPDRRRLLHRASAGNPLYLKALMSAKDRVLAHLAEGAPEAAEPIEDALLAVLRRELDGLGSRARLMAGAAAVAGAQASLDLVAHIAEVDDGRAVTAFDELSDRAVGTVTGARFTFRHPLLRAAAYWTAGPGWRIAAHARAAEYLRLRDGPVALVAHHTERCARYGDEQAARTLGDAGVGYLDTAPSTAVRLLREALRILPDRAGLVPYRCSLLVALARGTGVAGDLAESRRLLHEIMQTRDQARAAAIAFSSVISRLLGQYDEARALLTAELRRPGQQRRVRAQLRAEAAATAVLCGDPQDGLHQATEAIRLVSGTEDPALAAAAHALRALAHLQTGQITDARTHSERAGWLVDSGPDAALLPHVELVAPLAWAHTSLERHDDAARHLARGIDLATRAGRSHALPYLLIVQATLWVRLGRLADAVETAEHAAEASRHIRSTETLAMSQAVLLLPTLWRHGTDAALTVAGEVSARRPRSAWWSGLARLDLARVYLAAGRIEDCHAECDLLDVRPTARPWPTDMEVRLLALRAVAAAAAGHQPAAREQSADALSQARTTGLAYPLGTAHEAHARVLARDDPHGATESARAAAGHYATAGALVDRGLTHQLLAEISASLGEVEATHAELGRAKVAYQAAGATWLSRQLARVQLRLAARVRRPAGARRSELTARERQVADLIVRGLTNREIAERLHLSPKTVEAHVSRVFSKLDVRSRIALASRLIGHDAPADLEKPDA